MAPPTPPPQKPKFSIFGRHGSPPASPPSPFPLPLSSPPPLPWSWIRPYGEFHHHHPHHIALFLTQNDDNSNIRSTCLPPNQKRCHDHPAEVSPICNCIPGSKLKVSFTLLQQSQSQSMNATKHLRFTSWSLRHLPPCSSTCPPKAEAAPPRR